MLNIGKPVNDPVKLLNLNSTHGGACSGSYTLSPRAGVSLGSAFEC